MGSFSHFYLLHINHIHFPNLEIKSNPMHFKCFYYVEYSESNGIFNIKNNDEIPKCHTYILTAIHHDLSNKRPVFKTHQNNKKNIHIPKAWIKSNVAHFI